MQYITPASQQSQVLTVHPSQRQIHVTPVSSPLYVVTSVFNPKRYYSRDKLYEGFEKMCECAGAILYTVEVALRDRHFEVTSPDNPRHIQLRSPSELFYKENMTNLGVERLPADWEYVAWIDADVAFTRPDWAVETVHLLQHYKVIQMFSHAQDVGPNYQPIESFTGFMYQYGLTGFPLGNPTFAPPPTAARPPYYGGTSGLPMFHPGYAWAARRSAYSDLGCLGDIAILGSGDHHMATALIGNIDGSLPPGIDPTYRAYWHEWQNRAETYIKRNVGHMPGLVQHYWHGKKRDRAYVSKWSILVENHFNYLLDLKYDPQGLLQLTERDFRLRDAIRNYFSARNEDSIDVQSIS